MCLCACVSQLFAGRSACLQRPTALIDEPPRWCVKFCGTCYLLTSRNDPRLVGGAGRQGPATTLTCPLPCDSLRRQQCRRRSCRWVSTSPASVLPKRACAITVSTDWASGADFSLVTPTIALATAAVTCGEMFVCKKTKQRCRGCVFIYAYSLPCLPAWCISRAALGGHRQSPVGSGGFNLSTRAPTWRPTH